MRVAADGGEGVAGVEGAVALVEEADVAGRVAGGGDAAEGAVEFAVGDEVCGGGAGAGEAAFDFALRLVGVEGAILARLFGEQAGVALGDGDVGRSADGSAGVLRAAEREGVEGADVVAVGVGEEDAADGAVVDGLRGGEDGSGGARDGGIDEGEAVDLGDEVAVAEAEAG